MDLGLEQNNASPRIVNRLSKTEEPDREVGLLDFPHRALHFMQCHICLESAWLRRRVCCDFQSCNECLLLYLETKVQEGKAQVRCLNDRCNVMMNPAEIRRRLRLSAMRDKFEKFLIDANQDPHIKTCPSCSAPYTIDPAKLKVSKRKLKQGVQVTCSQCCLVWCFCCQAPFHQNVCCKSYKDEDTMFKHWTNQFKDGQKNARQCPNCKVYVQRDKGCNSMICSQCDTGFCYRCGDRYLNYRVNGHRMVVRCSSRCRKHLRRLIRCSLCVGRTVALCLSPAIAVVGSVAITTMCVGGVVVFVAGGWSLLLCHKLRKKETVKELRACDVIKQMILDDAERIRALRDQETDDEDEERMSDGLEPAATPDPHSTPDPTTCDI